MLEFENLKRGYKYMQARSESNPETLPEPCKARDAVFAKLAKYFVEDNRKPKTFSESVSTFFSGHGESGRISADDFITKHWKKSGSEFILSAYEFMQSSGAGKTLRKRIGEGLCNYYNVADEVINREVHTRILLYAASPLGTGSPIDHHKVVMEVIDTHLKSHISELRRQKHFGNDL